MLIKFQKGKMKMKKFSKLLILLLTLVVVMTAFTVTILAADSEGTETVLPPIKRGSVINYNDLEDGAKITNSTSKKGKWTAVATPDGNVYALWEYEDASANNEENRDFYTSPSSANNIWDYPYTAMDFDIMTTVGKYPGATVLARYKAGSSNNFGASFSLSNVPLSKTPYDWQHVTLVWEFAPTVDGLNYVANFKLHAYVNGKSVGTFDLGSSPSFIKSMTTEAEFKTAMNHEFRLNPGRNTSTTMGFDNLELNMFPKGYTLDEISTYVYDEEYELPFKTTVATITDAEDNVTYFDDMNKAVAAAAKGDTIQLADDVDGVVTVDKEIIIDTNKYVDGVATGEFYAIEYTSNKMAPTVKDGKVTFADAGEKKVAVYWDFCMTCETCESTHGGEGCTCTCGAAVPGHIMSSASEAIIGTTTIYNGTVPTFDIVDGISTTFAGWSRTLGGKAEDIVITNDDLAVGWIVLYPVYEVITYTFEVTSSSGAITYYTADKFATMFADVSAGSTIKLLRDLDTDAASVTVNKKLTIDMNGFDIRRAVVYGTTYRYANGDDTDEVVSTVASATTMFVVGSGFDLTITSGKEGSEFYIVNMKRDVWVDADGNEVKHTSGKTTKTTFMSASGTSFKLNLENIDIYATCFIYQAYRSGNNMFANINNCGLYRVYDGASTMDGMFVLAAPDPNSQIKITNSLIYNDAISFFIRHDNTSQSVRLIMDNCDIISVRDGNNRICVSSDHQQITNCRYYNIYPDGSFAPVISGSSLIHVKSNDKASYDKIVAAIPEGYIISPTNEVRTYNLPTTATLPLDENGFPIFAFAMEEQTLTFDYAIGEPVTVTLMHNGEVYDTITTALGANVATPEFSYDMPEEHYRNGKYFWVNAEGKADYAITDKNAQYVFYTTKTIDGVGDYNPKIAGAQLSLIYLTQFHMVLYLPVDPNMETVPTVSGANGAPANLENVVYINDVAYWAYTYWTNTDEIFKTKTSTVTYTIEGVTYTRNVTFSGIQYAELVLTNAGYTNEYESVANMVRYVREHLEAREITAYDAKIAELIGTANADGSTTGGIYNLPAYATEYEDVQENIAALAPYISSLQYGVSGGSTTFILNLTAKAKEDNIRITISSNGIDPGLWTNPDANGNPQTWTAWTAKNINVNDIIAPMTITITVPGSASEDSEDATATEPQTITATFSMGAYIIENPDVEIAKALYAFGVSAKAYRKSVGG